jgi:hypothetical protein
MDTLTVGHSTSLPMREVSALATRTGQTGRELLAVPRILVLSSDVRELLQSITLVVPDGQPGYGIEWRDNPNERAEGLALLTGGHVLVAKQKNPVYLIEFGPAGDTADGIRPDTTLSTEAAFDRPADEVTEFVPLASWPLGETTAKTLPTVNDIATGPDQRLYLISSKGLAIARLEERLGPDERARAEHAWKIDRGIPGGEEARPEGLALAGGARPTVGIDTKVAGDNVVQLNALA